MRGKDDELADRWFRILKHCPNPGIRLVCFPHAGGAASFFRPWAPFVPDGVELVAVRYPGREDRLLDPPVETMEGLAEPIARACSRFTDAPLVFFGHSMGASVAAEVAQRLQPTYGTTLAALFVSGRAGPGRQKPSGLAEVSDAELVASVGLLGGTNPQAFEDPELLELILPPIRADYRLIDRYEPPVTGAGVDAPVVAYYGNQDPRVDGHAVEAWSSVTRSTFTTRAFDGGHFYLADQPGALLEDLFTRLGTPVKKS